MKKYKITVIILSLIIIIQGIFILIIVSPKKTPKALVKPPISVKARIAIVLDDWGYNLNNLNALEEIKYPLTIAILPNLDYSEAIAQALIKKKYEIILHLPMEPHEKTKLEKNTVMISMKEEAVSKIIDLDLKNIKQAKGVSGHMGSRATEDLKTMTTVFNELKKRRLYFLDSFVSPKSVCSLLAGQVHLLFAKRDVFLDNDGNPEYIRKQIYRLKEKAEIYGSAIGIGHDRRSTLEVLSELMPVLEREGYKFVFVSDLVRSD